MTILENSELRCSVLVNGIEVFNWIRPRRPRLERHLARVLEWIDQSALVGLERIQLIDQLRAGEPRALPWYREQILRGWYADPATTSEPASIVLYIPHILAGLPRWLWWTPAATILIARTLAHEVFHHISRSSDITTPNYAEEESAANEYSIDLRNRMQRGLRYRLGQRLIREVADDHWIWGLTCWKAGERERAVGHWLQTLRLVPDHPNGLSWYWRGVREIEGKGQGSTSEIPASDEKSPTA